MKTRYKGLPGIAALRLKVKDAKEKAAPKQFETKFLSQFCKVFTGNRRNRRLKAKEWKNDNNE